MNAPATVEETRRALTKALPEATLSRIPKHPRRRDILLAAIGSRLERRYPYSESELNAELKSALEAVDALVDHVTCRRYMIDCGFIKRDRAGSRYYLNYPKLETTLSEEALGQARGLLEEALQVQRDRVERNKQKRR